MTATAALTDSQERKLAVMAINAFRAKTEAGTPKARQIADARFDGIASVAADVLGLTMTPFAFRMAVAGTMDAMGAWAFPPATIGANSPNGRRAWMETAVDGLLHILALDA